MLPSPTAGRPLRPHPMVVLALLCAISCAGGCTTTRYLSMRDVRENALANTLQLMGRRGPQVSVRTATVLKRFGLESRYQDHPQETLAALHQLLESTREGELTFAIAELAYIEGKKAERKGHSSEALNHYGLALTNSYDYLFDEDLQPLRNPYDPQFRGACEIYNEALEDTLRLLCNENRLRPGQMYTIQTPERAFTIETVARGKWAAEELDRYEFVSDYRIETLRNRHMTYGLGVPLIAVRRPTQPGDPRERYYPEGLSYAVTALLRRVDGSGLPSGPQAAAASDRAPHCVLEFFDPLSENQIRLADRWVPLETDLTTPLAFFLDSPQFRKRDQATAGLLNPAKLQETRGLYMLEPYDPNRIPVVMVHGLWSSPLTWMDMFNDLRSFPEIRDRYQFWFYMYPSGQPFWISATQMRGELAAMRAAFDPRKQDAPMDAMVLVGHSMGGLISRMQTIDSKDDFWRIVSDQPYEMLKGDEEDRTKLASALFFKPNASVRRVVTIGTPHRGSDFANDYTRWLARKFIKLPNFAVSTGTRLTRANPGFFKDTQMLTVSNAIDSLAPESPIFPVLMRAEQASDVRLHNIVGLVEDDGWLARLSRGSDGVVEYESAHLENAASELIVNADHTSIHTTSKAILEVRRILLEHLAELDSGDRLAEESGSLRSASPGGTKVQPLPVPDLQETQSPESMAGFQFELLPAQ